MALAQPVGGAEAALPVAVTQRLAGGTSKQSQRQPQPVCSRAAVKAQPPAGKRKSPLAPPPGKPKEERGQSEEESSGCERR